MKQVKQTKLLVFIFLLVTSSGLNAQVGVGTTTPSASAQLDVSSTTKGFLPPRVTESQRNAIATPAAGLMVWCSDCSTAGEMQVYNGTAWKNMTGGAASPNPNPSVNICAQVWMLKNLDVSTYRNGDPIPRVDDQAAWAALTTGAYCYHNNDSAANAATYGKLYNYYAVIDPRGLAPAGWHVPSQSEWNTLALCLDNLADINCGNCLVSFSAGAAMKETGTAHWTSPNTGATNSSGFTGLGAGNRSANGDWEWFNSITFFWGSLGGSGNNWRLWYNNTNLYKFSDNYKNGFSVRCIKD